MSLHVLFLNKIEDNRKFCFIVIVQMIISVSFVVFLALFRIFHSY